MIPGGVALVLGQMKGHLADVFPRGRKTPEKIGERPGIRMEFRLQRLFEFKIEAGKQRPAEIFRSGYGRRGERKKPGFGFIRPRLFEDHGQISSVRLPERGELPDVIGEQLPEVEFPRNVFSDFRLRKRDQPRAVPCDKQAVVGAQHSQRGNSQIGIDRRRIHGLSDFRPGQSAFGFGVSKFRT